MKGIDRFLNDDDYYNLVSGLYYLLRSSNVDPSIMHDAVVLAEELYNSQITSKKKENKKAMGDR